MAYIYFAGNLIHALFKRKQYVNLFINITNKADETCYVAECNDANERILSFVEMKIFFVLLVVIA